MNYPDSSKASTTAKKMSLSSATRALFLGLVLLLPGVAALAEIPAPGRPSPSGQAGKAAGEQTSDALSGMRGTPGLPSPSGPDIAKAGEAPLPGLASPGPPIQGTSVGLEGDPGSIKVSANTDSTGVFNFGKLPAGKYKLTLAGLPPQSITVAADGGIKGIVSRQPDGKASIDFDRQDGIVFVLPWRSTDANPAGRKEATNPGFEPPKSGFAGMGGGGPGILPDARVWQLMQGQNGPAMSPGPMGPGPMGAGPAGPGGGAMRR